MAWSFVPNCHVQLWNGVAIGVTPTGAPTLDVAGQLLTAKVWEPATAPNWLLRLVLVNNANLTMANMVPVPATHKSYVLIVDDTTGISQGYFQVLGVSPSTQPNGSGGYTIPVVFILLLPVTL